MSDNAPMLSRPNQPAFTGQEPAIWPEPNCSVLIYTLWPNNGKMGHWLYRGGLKGYLYLDHDQLMLKFRYPISLPRKGLYKFVITIEPNLFDREDDTLIPVGYQRQFTVDMSTHAPRGDAFIIVRIEKIYLWKVNQATQYWTNGVIVFGNSGLFEFGMPDPHQ